MEYNNIITENRGSVGIITLNRPKALNAICEEMLKEIATQVTLYDNDNSIRAIIIKGSEKAFAAGIDIKELYTKISDDKSALDNTYNYFAEINVCRKPIIGAVAGYALGIGCELALACDIILASDNTKFGQPDLSLGTIPGFGATQRLTKTIGKAKTMEMILTGRALNVEEAERCGIVSRIIPLHDLFEESIKTAMRIAAQSPTAVKLAKDAINHALELGLNDGIDYENKNCKLCLLSEEFKESLATFIENRRNQA